MIAICGRCHRERRIEAKGLCDSCYHVVWLSSHPEAYQKQLERQRVVIEANREKYRERSRNWHRKNRAIDPSRFRSRYSERRKGDTTEGNKATAKAWRVANAEKYRTARAVRWERRRQRKKALSATLTVEQWRAILKAYKGCCAYCGSKSSNLTQDHIIPVARGGAYSVENIVPACSACNTAKGTKEPSIIPAKRLFF